MTKMEFIVMKPKSYLARNLNNNNWPNDAEIVIVGGLDAVNDKRSNLHKATRGGALGCCIGGHRQRGTEGWWWAVKLPKEVVKK